MPAAGNKSFRGWVILTFSMRMAVPRCGGARASRDAVFPLLRVCAGCGWLAEYGAHADRVNAAQGVTWDGHSTKAVECPGQSLASEQAELTLTGGAVEVLQRQPRRPCEAVAFAVEGEHLLDLLRVQTRAAHAVAERAVVELAAVHLPQTAQ